jgi:hypothetical protein
MDSLGFGLPAFVHQEVTAHGSLAACDQRGRGRCNTTKTKLFVPTRQIRKLAQIESITRGERETGRGGIEWCVPCTKNQGGCNTTKAKLAVPTREVRKLAQIKGIRERAGGEMVL